MTNAYNEALSWHTEIAILASEYASQIDNAVKEVMMTSTKTPIRREDIRTGDLIRREYDVDSAQEYRAVSDGLKPRRGNDSRYFLLDRPRKLIHAKGTTLYLTHDHHNAKKGDPVTVLKDYFEDQHLVRAVQADGFKDGYPYEYWLTTEKPRVLKWAKGTRLWFKDSAENRACNYEGGYTVGNDVYEDNRYVDGAYFPSRFTTEKPEPHPVGAIRWVTQDHNGAYGVKFKRGDRVVVERTAVSGSGYRDSDIVLKIDPRQEGWHTVYGWRKYLSTTRVVPWIEPTVVPASFTVKACGAGDGANTSVTFSPAKGGTVTHATLWDARVGGQPMVPVRKSAIDKLRDEHARAYAVHNDRDNERNRIRRKALNTFFKDVDGRV